MTGAVEFDLLAPHELGPVERDAWRAFRAASPDHDSPYHDLRYILCAGAVAPHAKVAVFRRRGRLAGFLAFQRRGAMVQPLGAPMTDYHGVLAAPGERIDVEDILPGLRARAFRFTGLTTGAGAPPGGVLARARLAADLSAGFDAWLAERKARFPKFYREKPRTARALERDLGPLRLEWSAEPRPVLDYVLTLKRAQYRRTGRHDVFACGWTERLLHRLVEAHEPDFGLRFAGLYAGERLIGAEIGLLSGSTYHLWLPAYDPGLAKYGPGMLTTLETMRVLPEAGVTRVDFGRDDAAYKAYFADPVGEVHEGMACPPRRLGMPARLAALRERLGRRFDVIAACETTAWGRCAGAALALGVAATTVLPLASISQVRRPNVHRPHHQMVARAAEGIRDAADRVRASAG